MVRPPHSATVALNPPTTPRCDVRKRKSLRNLGEATKGLGEGLNPHLTQGTPVDSHKTDEKLVGTPCRIHSVIS